jgi:hypothetical protein
MGRHFVVEVEQTGTERKEERLKVSQKKKRSHDVAMPMVRKLRLKATICSPNVQSSTQHQVIVVLHVLNSRNIASCQPYLGIQREALDRPCFFL